MVCLRGEITHSFNSQPTLTCFELCFAIQKVIVYSRHERSTHEINEQ